MSTRLNKQKSADSGRNHGRIQKAEHEDEAIAEQSKNNQHIKENEKRSTPSDHHYISKDFNADCVHRHGPIILSPFDCSTTDRSADSLASSLSSALSFSSQSRRQTKSLSWNPSLCCLQASSNDDHCSAIINTLQPHHRYSLRSHKSVSHPQHSTSHFQRANTTSSALLYTLHDNNNSDQRPHCTPYALARCFRSPEPSSLPLACCLTWNSKGRFSTNEKDLPSL